MKNLMKLAAVAFVVSVSVIACDPPKSTSGNKPDTLSTTASTKVIDTTKVDSSGNVLAVKKDSTTTKTEKKVTEKK